MESRTELRALVAELLEAKREYSRLRFDVESETALGPPASVEQIRKLERFVGQPLPPSYRAFLELHNGWADFDGSAKLLAVEDHECEWVRRRIKDWGETVDDDSQNPFLTGVIPILLGEVESNFLALDPSTSKATGEMDFISYDYLCEEDRFEDFTTFLKANLKVLQGLIDDETTGTAA